MKSSMEREDIAARRARARERAAQKRRRKRQRIIIWSASFLLAVCVGVGAYFGVTALHEMSQYTEGDDAYLALAAQVGANQGTAPGAAQTPSQGEGEGEALPAPAEGPAIVDFDALKAVTKDAVGWLYCPGTPINYPLVQGSDNLYYMNHLPGGKRNVMGSMFVDYENEPFADDNTVVYGHNMKNGSMMHCLLNYREETYYREHPRMAVTTLAGGYTLELIAGFEASANLDFYRLRFSDFPTMEAYVERIRGLSDFQSGVAVAEGDKLVTLSTCAYDVRDGRYLVVGKLVPEG